MERMILIAAMVVVTFIPRAIPAALIEKMRFPKKVEKFLNLIPYTAMASRCRRSACIPESPSDRVRRLGHPGRHGPLPHLTGLFQKKPEGGYHSPMEMRFATEEDAPALLEIYGQYIDTPITFETELPSLEDFRWRIREFSRDYPYLVSVQDGRITGYAYAHKAFTRDAYRFDAETTIYLSRDAQHSGIGPLLYEKLLDYLRRMNVVNAYALVTEPNRQSVYFHQRMGFRDFATFQDTGYKLGRWISVIWLVKVLNPRKDRPAELRSIRDVLAEEQA